MEQVIHKMTQATAQRFGISERGSIQEGFYADVTILDPEALAVNLDVPHSKPGGIRYVLVNGVPAVDAGTYSPQDAGQVLRKV